MSWDPGYSVPTPNEGDDEGGGSGGAPSGAAGGALSGTYPNPSLSSAKQQEIDDAAAAAAAASDDVADIATALAASGKGYVEHGAVANTARPTGYASVEWYGTVEPDNWIDGDTWNDPT